MRFIGMIALPYLIVASGCGNSDTHHNFADCVKKKTAEYIDAGANPWEGGVRAEGFCETKYPLLKPSYEPISGLTITVNRSNLCAPEIRRYCTYTFHFSQPTDLVTFSVSSQTGSIGTFTRVEVYNQKVSYTPDAADTDVHIASAKVIQAFVDVNKGKHHGD